MRKIPLINGKYYHIFNRSIAKYLIFNDSSEYSRMVDIIGLFRFADFRQSYSNFIKLTPKCQAELKKPLQNSPVLVEIIAYCLMPTHFHLILKQNIDNGITNYMARVQNSYSRYFNMTHKRKGPLWEGHFSNVLIESDELMFHVTRYIHLNPVTVKIVEQPEDWDYYSYKEYTKQSFLKICCFKDIINMKPSNYKKFVNDQIAYQRELSKIKHLLIENYSG